MFTHNKKKGLFQLTFIILLIVLKAFILQSLWLWFIIPYFNFAPLPFAISVGIVSMFTLLIHLPVFKFDDYEQEYCYYIQSGTKPIIILAFGYLVHLIS